MRFGQVTDADLKAQDVATLFEVAKDKAKHLKDLPISKILKVLDATGKLWHKDGHFYQIALKALPSELSFSPQMIEKTLDIIPELLNINSLAQRIELELGKKECLDDFQFIDSYKQFHKFESLGTLVHISAGNVFLGCIDSLLMGLLTKNVNILKLSSQNQIFPKLFAESLSVADTDGVLCDKFAICYWRGGDQEIEIQVKKYANAIICWGGFASIQSWKKDLPVETKIFDYGPKISFQVLSQKYLDGNPDQDLWDRLAKDICLWDQAACASAQVLYIQKGVDADLVFKKLSHALGIYPLARGKLDPNEEVEILKFYFRSQYHADETQMSPVKGEDFTIVFDPNSTLSVSPLNRTVVIKKFDDQGDLVRSISPFAYNLQSCALAVHPAEYQNYCNQLAAAGVTRLVTPGSMLEGKIGGPHDGRFGLSELVKIISFENDHENLNHFLFRVATNTPYFQKYLNVPFAKWPLMTGQTVSDFGPAGKNPSLLTSNQSGFYFASGGTTGNPKYSFYTYEEFDRVCQMMGEAYKILGLKAGQRVANLFVSGNMWSSFSAVQKALEKCEVVQLPVGGQCEPKYIQEFFTKFNPEIVFGIPSLLAELSKKVTANIHTVFYAGETLSDGYKQILAKNWNIKNFYSAGYASVDVGPIGYQVPGGDISEHYLFDGIYLEEIDGEAVVTSTIRESMPVIRYQTGDRIEILEKFPQVKFKLLGRHDQTIFIWSSRIPLQDIYDSFKLSNLALPLQIQVRFNSEKLEDEIAFLVDKACASDEAQFKKHLYQLCKDLEQTVEFAKVINGIVFENTSKIQFNLRTGKCAALVDQR